MPTTARTYRTAARRVGQVALATAATCCTFVLAAGPAAAAPSCAGLVFSGVAQSEPGAVAGRVAFLKDVIIPAVEPEGTTFGHVISRKLAQADCS